MRLGIVHARAATLAIALLAGCAGAIGELPSGAAGAGPGSEIAAMKV